MSYPAYPEYKDSNEGFLGKVPSTWSISPLKHNCTILPSNVDKHTDPGEAAVRLCNYTDVYYQDRIVESLELMKASASRDQIEKFTLQAQDVVITKDSESADDIAIPSFVPKSLPNVVCGYHLAIIRPSRAVDGLFLNYLLMAKQLRAYFEISARGLTRVGLSQFALGGAKVAWPPKEEQIQIALFLDHQTARIDALIAEQQRLIELLKEKRQAVISHAVTKGLDPDAAMKDSGVEWLGDIPEHWGVTRLKYASELIVDCPHETPNYDPEGDFLVIRTADIENGVLDPKSMYRLNEHEYNHRVRREPLLNGDIVYGREGERWGHAAIVPKSRRYALGQRMMQIRPARNISSRFLMWMLNSRNVYRQGETDIVGATSPHINISTITNYNLACPPLSEQEKVAQFLAETTGAYDSLIAQAEDTTNLLYERRSALISAAVTGKIDVRDWGPPTSEAFAGASVAEGATA